MSTQTQIAQVIADGGVQKELAQSIAKKLFEEIFKPLVVEEPGKEAPPEIAQPDEPETLPKKTEPGKQIIPRPPVPDGLGIDDREAVD